VAFAAFREAPVARALTLRRCAALARRGAIRFDVRAARQALADVEEFRAEALAG
jgi:hypothetical protein